MPTYAYDCLNCGHSYEKFNPVKDRAEGGHCDVCGSLATRQAVSAPAGINGGFADTKIRLSKTRK